MNEQRNERTGRNRRRYIAAAAAAVILASGAFGVQAFAESRTFAHMKHYASSEYGGWQKGRHGFGGGAFFSGMSEAEIDAVVARMIRHVAIEIDATPEQTEKITELVAALAKDMQPMHASMRDAGKEFHALLTAETIDREALERLRAERLAEAERISRDVVATLADVAEVLSAEQRKLLDERIAEFRGMRGRWHRN